MCGRFTLRTPTALIAERFTQLELLGSIEFPDIPANYNVAPTHSVATIRHPDEQPEFAWLRWGLLPSWAKEKKIGARMINARSETVREKPAYRSAFKRRRCLVLADGFYEWLNTPDGKQPMYMTMEDDQPFAMAGLWESNSKVDEAVVESCTVITTSANPMMSSIHDRMPVILPFEKIQRWLDPAFEDYDSLHQMLTPFEGPMKARPVARNVNKVAYNEPDCIDPISE